MTRPIITLTTDFGHEGYYLGAMRGVLLKECPHANLVDITHSISPFSAIEGSFILDQAARMFPERSVHLAVVDPGVGGLRKPIFLQSGGHWFVGPDNGLFTPFFEGAEAIYRIKNDTLPPSKSNTFDGRDIFAPVAGRLAAGADPTSLGEPTTQVARLHIPRPRKEPDNLQGKVLFHDHFGNLITNIKKRDLEEFGGKVEVWVGTSRLRRLARTYDDAALGSVIALIGSSGHLEIAVCQGNAAAHLGAGKGERVRVVHVKENVTA